MSQKLEIPIDYYGKSIPITPRNVALARTVYPSISSSTEVELQTDTRFLRVYAISQDVYLRWGIEDVNASTFDEVIPAGQIVDLTVPVQPDGSLYTHLNVVERVSGATVIIIEK